MFHALMHLHLLFVQFQIKQMIWQHMLFSRQHMKQCLHDSGATLCNVLFSISIQSKFKHILFKIGVTVATTYLFSTYMFLLLLWSGFMSEADLHDSLAKNQAICCHPSENIKGSHKFMPLAIVLNFFSVSSFLLSSSFQGAAALE